MTQELEILEILMMYRLPFCLKGMRMTVSRYSKIFFELFLFCKWDEVAAVCLELVTGLFCCYQDEDFTV